jgi:hypothetical protein
MRLPPSKLDTAANSLSKQLLVTQRKEKAVPARRVTTVQAQAVAAPQAPEMKVYRASQMSAAELKEATARPRVDFSSILGSVSSGMRRVEFAPPVHTLAHNFFNTVSRRRLQPAVLTPTHSREASTDRLSLLHPHPPAGGPDCGGCEGSRRCSSAGIHSQIRPGRARRRLRAH